MNNKLMTAITIVILIAVVLFGVISQRQGENEELNLEEYENTAMMLDTVNTIRTYGPGGEEAVQQAFSRLEEIEVLQDLYDEESSLNRINENAGGEPVEVEAELLEVLEMAKEFAAENEGAFDPTIGALTLLWGWGSEEGPSVPAQEDIEQALELVDYNKLEIFREEQTARLAEEGMILDLGAIAKGYAGDEAVDVLLENEIERAFVNLGGNIVLLGTKPDETPWRIGIQNPRSDRGRAMGSVDIDEEDLINGQIAVATSGDYERFFEDNDTRYHHIIDPETGYPAEGGAVSTTVVSENPSRADALSTGLFVLGLERGLDLAETLEGVEAVFITEDKEIYLTSGLEVDENFQLMDDDFTVVN